MSFFFKSQSDVPAPLSVIIIGCGKVGATITERLVQEGNDVTVVDQDETKAMEIATTYDVLGIVGNGASNNVLQEAGIDEADLLVAVTDSDELNLLCCTLAHRTGHCATIARVRTPDYARERGYLKAQLGLTMIINPEMESALEIARILSMPAALEVTNFAHGQAQLIKFQLREQSKLIERPVYDIMHSVSDRFLFCAVERSGEVFIPNGSTVFETGDRISFVAPRHRGMRCLEQLGIKNTQVRNCMIIGGGKCSYYLAEQLLRSGIDVKIIERSPKRCDELAELLPNAIIIQGDGANEALLKEEGIDTVDSFVALTGMDEENILLTLHLREVSDAKVITKINRFAFSDVVAHLDLGSVVYPRLITSEAIIAYARGKRASNLSGEENNIETLYHMFDSKAEAIEFCVDTRCEACDIPLKDLKLKPGVCLVFIGRGKQIIFPGGNDKILVGDHVMVVTTQKGFNELDDMLS